MEVRLAFILFAAIATFLPDTFAVAQARPKHVVDAEGRIRNILDPQAQTGGLAGDLSVVSPKAATADTRTAAHEGLQDFDCAGMNEDSRRVIRTSHVGGELVDACGRRSGARTSSSTANGQVRSETPTRGQSVESPTIDRMTTRVMYDSHDPADGLIRLIGSADVYQLSDGSQWSSGAGSSYYHGVALDRIEISGETIRYVMSPSEDGLIYEQTDYNYGDHSAQGALAAAGELVIEATLGSHIGVLRGNTRVSANDATWYGEPRFNYYSAIVGAIVPFEVVITLSGEAWTPITFERAFSYSSSGWVDFAHPISIPKAVELTISGPGRIPDESSTAFIARVRYANGTQRDVSADAVWSVLPSDAASVAQGVLTIGALTVPEQLLTLNATYNEGEASLLAEKQVRCLTNLAAESPGSWPMFQADSRHTGSLLIQLVPTLFDFKWQRNFGDELALNPVTAGDGKVFVSLISYSQSKPRLFALQASDGTTIWSKSFGNVFSINPPSYAYGNVYLQTGNHSTDTWLYAFDGEAGELIFKAPHQAQWEHYYAPTIHNNKVYVNGGYYGGMYAFDAFTGSQLWFAGLPQYDQWTPAVDGDRVYAYVGEYAPGLYGGDSLTGTPTLFTADPNFDWNGWSMDLAPVIGGFKNILAVHNGRLISFDSNSNVVRWELQSQFSGQPSVSRGRIYANDGGKLVVLNEETHDQLWSWQPPLDVLAGPMIVTDTHLLVSGAARVYAVDLSTRQSVWSYAVSGQLAMADDTLYVASADGTVTAFATPRDLLFKDGFE